MASKKELPQWHPGAQIREDHPEDNAVQIDQNKTDQYNREAQLKRERGGRK